MEENVDVLRQNFEREVANRKKFFEIKEYPQISETMIRVQKMREIQAMVAVLGLTKAEVDRVFWELDIKDSEGKPLTY